MPFWPPLPVGLRAAGLGIGLGGGVAVKAAAVLTNGVHQYSYVVRCGELGNAVAQVEDMAAMGGVPTETVQHPAGLPGHTLG